MKRIFACIVILILLVVFTNGEPRDFAAPYNGASAAIQGVSPYSDSVMLQNQLDFYGRPAEAHEDQHRTSYPLTTLLLYAPLTALPITTAAFVFRILSALLLVAALVRFGASPLWALVVLLLSREPVTAFFLGQTPLLATAFAVLALDALKRQQQVRAAGFFALGTLHPVLTLPLALLVLLPHRRALTAFVGVMAAWLALSLAIGGFWIPQWVTVVTAYSSYVSYMVWLPRTLPLLIPLGVLLAYFALRQRESLTRYAFALSSVVLLLPITGLYHMTLFAPVLARRPRRYVIALGAAAWVLSSIAPFDIRQFTPLLFVAVAIPEQGYVAFVSAVYHQLAPLLATR